jgi:hypothetical protein
MEPDEDSQLVRDVRAEAALAGLEREPLVQGALPNVA